MGGARRFHQLLRKGIKSRQCASGKLDGDHASEHKDSPRKRFNIVSLVTKFGFDILFVAVKYFYGYMDLKIEKEVSTSISSNAFVTFNDLASATCASSAPLCSDDITISAAPEPRG